jgi:hypothetical protein
VKGRNVLAVEVHQVALNSSDLRFNLRLDALLVPSSNTGGDPAISYEPATESLRITWPAAFTGFSLQQRRSFADTTDWEPSPYPVTSVGGTNVVTVPLSEDTLLLRLSK